MSQTTVNTKCGTVQGYEAAGVCVWKGIPFAKPPVGPLRFQPPEPVEEWTGVRSAKAYGPSAHQPEDAVISRLTGRSSLAQQEDCLYLNVWSPGADERRRPVLVWIHGGAYVTGSGSIAWYDGTSFAAAGDVVVVTLNYRLGALGWLCLDEVFGEDFAGTGNLGLLDQIAALRWVHENIEAFGGDPRHVTIFGESAGAGSVGALLAAPAARGLYSQAVMQSGSGSLGVHTTKSATDTARTILEKVGVEPGDVKALYDVSAEALVDAGAALGGGLAFGPVIDGVVLTEHPLQALAAGSARDIPVLIGANLEEYKLFTLGDPGWYTTDEAELRQRIHVVLGAVPSALIDFYLQEMPGDSLYDKVQPLLTYAVFVRGMLQTVERQVEQGAPTYVYRFDWKSTVLDGRLGACHAQEIPFVFNNLHQLGVERFTGDSPLRDAIAEQMHHAWISFAKTGNPNHAGLPAWPSYNERSAVMTFGLDTEVVDDPYGPEQRAWIAATGGGH